MAASNKKKKKRNVNNAGKPAPKKTNSGWIIGGIVALCALLVIGFFVIRSRKAANADDSSQAQLEDSLVIDNGGEAAAAIAEDSERLEDAMEGFTQIINGENNSGWEAGGDTSGEEGSEGGGGSAGWTGEGGNSGGGYGGGGDFGPIVTAPPMPTPTFQPLPVESLSFPYTIPGTGLTIEQVSPYSGYFLEDGSGDAVSNVMTIVLKNSGGDLSFAGIGITHNDRNLAFIGSNIPAGSTVIIQEQNRAPYYDGYYYSATANTTDSAGFSRSSEAISITDNGDNTFTVTNNSGESISSAVISYKSYLPEDDVYVGGITYTVKLDGLDPDTSIVVNSSHYVSGYSVIMDIDVAG